MSQVRAVTQAQAEAGIKWIQALRQLEDFKNGKFFNTTIDNRNLDPGSSIDNLTRNISAMPRVLHQDVRWSTANDVVLGTINQAMDKWSGSGSKGKNLFNALLELIGGQLELQPTEKDAMRQTLFKYFDEIELQTKKTKEAFAADATYMIQSTSLRNPDLDEVDIPPNV